MWPLVAMVLDLTFCDLTFCGLNLYVVSTLACSVSFFSSSTGNAQDKTINKYYFKGLLWAAFPKFHPQMALNSKSIGVGIWRKLN